MAVTDLTPTEALEAHQAASSRFFHTPEVAGATALGGCLFAEARNQREACDIASASFTTLALLERIQSLEADVDLSGGERFVLQDQQAIWRRESDRFSATLALNFPNQPLFRGFFSENGKIYRNRAAGDASSEVVVFSSMLSQEQLDNGVSAASYDAWKELLVCVMEGATA